MYMYISLMSPDVSGGGMEMSGHSFNKEIALAQPMKMLLSCYIIVLLLLECSNLASLNQQYKTVLLCTSNIC